jgi:AAA family ATP:ADP antiporter
VPDRTTRSAIVAAVGTAAVMIAFQTAGKATRDSLFLSCFDVTALPRMVTVAAVLSVVLALFSTRLLAARGPARIVPVAFAVSGALLIVEWFLVEWAPRPTAVLFYLHYAALGGVLISGFWSQVNERFDPRTARRHVGRIAAGASVGSVLGGVLSVRVGATLSVQAMLPLLALMHLGCAWLALAIERGQPDYGGAGRTGDEGRGLRTISGTPYLRMLAGLVLLTTASEFLIDYVFKAQAAASHQAASPQAAGFGGPLLQFFAWYYTVVALLAVVVQVVLGRLVMERGGITRTIASLPLVVAVGGVGALLVPGFASVVLVRGGEAVARNSLYRGGWELLFGPLPTAEKRATKPLMDVGVVRLGDIIGATLVQVVILLAVGWRPLLAAAIFLALLALALCVRLQRAYTATLERNLRQRAGLFDENQLRDSALRTALLHTSGGLQGTLAAVEPATAADAPSQPVPDEPEAARLAALRSRDAARVSAALRAGPLSRALVPHAVSLLAWDVVARDAIENLQAVAPDVVGQLLDRLLDPEEDFTIRRRLPLVLAYCSTQRAVDGLLEGLEDARFEVRYRCGKALSRLLKERPELRVDGERVRRACVREVAVDQAVWKSTRLLDALGDDAWSPVMDGPLRDRANRSLEHVFTMLALMLPAQPLQLAFRALHTDDPNLRGTALEYLDGMLPEDVRGALWPFLEDTRTIRPPARPAKEVIDDLLKSRASIALKLQQMRRTDQT